MSALKNEAGNTPKRALNQRFGPNCSDLDPAEVSAGPGSTQLQVISSSIAISYLV